MLKYDLEENEMVEGETLQHCLTVLYALLKQSDEAFDNDDVNLSLRKQAEAEKYLKSYFCELFKQNNLTK